MGEEEEEERDLYRSTCYYTPRLLRMYDILSTKLPPACQPSCSHPKRGQGNTDQCDHVNQPD